MSERSESSTSMSSPRRVVVVGADAAGMSAAHQALRTAKRLGKELAVTVLDRGTHTSYSACGIPYWMAGDVGSGDDLVARTADEHRSAGIDLRMETEVVAADLAARTVTTAAGEAIGFDELVVATGAPATVPDWALRPDGTTYDGVGAVKTLDDGAAWLERFDAVGASARVVVVGAGYVGLEVVEAALRRGFGVTVLTRGRGMSMLEDEMSDRVNAAMCAAGAEVVLGAEVTGLDTDGDRVTGVRWDGGSREADLVVVAIGVRPATDFLVGSGLEMADNGALRPDRHGRVADYVWAAGDCCEVRRRIDDAWVFRPLGTYATKHGRALGDTLAGGGLAFDGMVERLHAGGRADRAVGDGRPDDPSPARRAGRRWPRCRQADRRGGRRAVGRGHGRRPRLDGPRLCAALLDRVGGPAGRGAAGGRTAVGDPGNRRVTAERVLQPDGSPTPECSLLRHSAGVRSVLSSHSSVP